MNTLSLEFLPKRLQKYIRQQVENGFYEDEKKAIVAAVEAQLIRERELELQEFLEEGLDSGWAGKLTDEFLEETLQNALALSKKSKLK